MKTDKLTSSFMALREKLHRSALSFLKNDEDAEDALQDTFFKLWKHDIPESDAEARNKLFAVLRNTCIDRLRKPRTLPLDESNSDYPYITPDPGEDISSLESLLTAELTDVQRRIYLLVAHDGLDYSEVASDLNMSVEAVRMNMSRARGKIRDKYKLLNK